MKKEKKSLFSGLFSKKKIDLNDNRILTPTQAIINNFLENKLAVTGLIGFVLILLFTFGGSMVVPFNEIYTETIIKNVAPGTNYLNVPKELNGNVKKIVSGSSFSYAIDKQGNLYSWGTDTGKALQIPADVKGKKVDDIAVSNRHVIALLSSGEVKMWGDNTAEQSVLSQYAETKLNGMQVDKVFAGPFYSGVLLNNKKVLTWGANNVQQLAFMKEWEGHIVDVQTTTENVVVLLDNGTVGVTGSNILTTSLPKELKDGSVKVKAIATAYLNGLALTEDGKLISWGAGARGLDVTKQFDQPVTAIAAGYNNFSVLLADGTVKVIGDNVAYGEDKAPAGKMTQVFSGYFQNYAVSEDGQVKAWGLKGFLIGTDELGRDIFVRLIHGGKTSLLVGLVAVVITTIIALIVGLISGFVGGVIDNLLMRFAEIVTSIPFLPLLITLSAVLGSGLGQTERMYLVMVIIGILSWVGLARLIRGQILIEREKDFILASRALGIKESKIIMKHILPSILSIVIVSMSLSYGGMMLTEAGLSFLGFGVLQPTPTWGNMLNGAQSAEVIQFYWWRWFFPALAVFITVLAVNLVGDGLRDAVDPKSNQK